MVVSVRLRIRAVKGSRLVDTVAGVNSHYPALLGPDEPELLLPRPVAEKVGLKPGPDWEIVERATVGGPAYGWFLKRAIAARVVERDRLGPEIVAHAYVVPSFPSSDKRRGNKALGHMGGGRG